MRKIFAALIEPKAQIAPAEKLFSDSSLRNLIIPLLMEQLLTMLVGIADTLMISYAGEAAVSGVSLMDMLNAIFIHIFTALAAGGAVVVSQYSGRHEQDNGSRAASQLYMISFVSSIVITALVALSSRQLISMLFGKAESAVTDAGLEYLKITALSYPALALYNAGAALHRSIGKTKVTMNVSIVMNIINAAGNAIGIFVLHAGVSGVAWPSVAARYFAAIFITVRCFSPANPVKISFKNIFVWDGAMLRRLMNIAVPNGIEGGLFQLSKVALSTITALFGTSQIAANGVAQSFWSMAALVNVAMSPAFITVIGQCMGACSTKAAEYYIKKMMRITIITSVLWNVLIAAVSPLVLMLYDLDPETKSLVFCLIIIHNVFNALISPFSGPFTNGLRAAGDVHYTMFAAIFSTVICRVFLSVLFGIWLNLGVIGIALAMAGDWCIKALLITLRYKSGAWKKFSVI